MILNILGERKWMSECSFGIHRKYELAFSFIAENLSEGLKVV